MFERFASFKRNRGPEGQFARLKIAERPDLIYAIGDVHGCYDQLRALEEIIEADARDAEGTKLIVMLGDYVDRGPKSAQVLDHLIAPPPEGFQRVCLAGNHEHVMLDFLADPSPSGHWLDFGGIDTLASYGATSDLFGWRRPNRRQLQQAIAAHIPEEHIGFMRELAACLEMPDYVFVHAGVRPGVPLDEQDEHDLLWIRDVFLDAPQPLPQTVVHGHTPFEIPTAAEGKINIDTGAFATGRLTAVRIPLKGEIRFLTATR